MKEAAQQDIGPEGQEVVAHPQAEGGALLLQLGEEGDVQEVDFQAVSSHQAQKPVQRPQGQPLQGPGQPQAQGDGEKEEEMALREVDGPGDPLGGEAHPHVGKAQHQHAAPEGQRPPSKPPPLHHIEAQQQAQEEYGHPIEKVGVLPVGLVGEYLAHPKPRQNPQGGEPLPVSAAPEQTEAQRGEGVKEHDAGDVPVKGAGSVGPVVEQGGIPQQGRPGHVPGQNEPQGPGHHHHKVGGENPTRPPGHKGLVALFPAAEGHDKPHGGEQDEQVHPAEARLPPQIQQGQAKVQVGGVKEHHPHHGHPHELRAAAAEQAVIHWVPPCVPIQIQPAGCPAG